MNKNDEFLEELFYGKIAPWERKNADLKSGKELVHQIGIDHTYLDSVLSEADRDVLEHMLDLLSHLAMAESCASFKDGYRLGGKAVLAVISDKENPS